MTKFLVTTDWEAIIGGLLSTTLCIVLIFVIFGSCVFGVIGLVRLFSWAIEEWF